MLHIPSDLIWIPDIILYNNADGEPHISIVSDAIIYFNGLVVWKPPSIYKSFCNIEIEYFPFDTQECLMKFGGWTYNGFLMNISQIPVGPDDKPKTLSYPDGREYKYLKIGMDLSAYNPHEQLYPGCCGQDFYIDITFRLVIRRKTLFFIVNLVIPCMLLG
uniref:Neur_chan_LBD domain-containing protein n=1 Tax=Meloidogyne hapla TaxID=6305 RepID=A0A1I8BDA8_MELHA